MTGYLAPEQILIVDDDRTSCAMQKHWLERARFRCRVVHEAADALELIAEGEVPDAILLDFHLSESGPTGLDVCRTIKAIVNVPILMVTADAYTRTLVSCFDAGVNDYLVKPVNQEELCARLRAAIKIAGRQKRRPNALVKSARQPGFELDYLGRRLRWNGNEVMVTEKEAAFLQLLVSAAPDILSREVISSVVFGREHDGANRNIDVLASRVRKRMRELRCEHRILSSRAKGYRLVFAAEAVVETGSG